MGDHEMVNDELQFLLYGVLLYVGLLAFRIATVAPFFPTFAVGNRDDKPDALQKGWRGRLERTLDNTKDSLIFFAIVVLVARERGISNKSTLLGARAYLVSRLLYVPIYVLGLPVVRSVVWAISYVGILVILFQAMQYKRVGTLYLETLDEAIDQLAALYTEHVQPHVHRHLEL